MTRSDTALTNTDTIRSATTRCFYWFSYFYGFRDDRILKQHHVRDGASFTEISSALYDLGYRYADRFANGPPSPEEYKRNKETMKSGVHLHIEEVVGYTQVDESFLRPGTMLVVPTRPPMDDLRRGDLIQSQPGFTSLEQCLFRVCRDYFACCSRACVELSAPIAAQLPSRYAHYAKIEFRQRIEPSSMWMSRPGGRKLHVAQEERRMMTYLLHLPEVEQLHGADLLLAFGIGGTQTLALAYRLRHDLSALLEHDGLTLVEMTVPEGQQEGTAKPECGGRWALDWKVEEIVPLGQLPQHEPRPQQTPLADATPAPDGPAGGRHDRKPARSRRGGARRTVKALRPRPPGVRAEP